MAQNKKLNYKVLFRLLKLANNYKRMYLLAIVSTLILAFLSPYRIKLIGDVIDKYIVETQDRYNLFVWVAIIVALLLLETLLKFVSTYFSSLLAQSVIYDIRVKLFRKLVFFRMQFFNKNPIGNIVTRLVSDLEAITDVFASGLMSIMGDLLMLIVTVVMMFYTNWELSLYVLLPIPILVFGTRIFAKAMHKSFQLESLQVSKLNTFVQEHIAGMSIVKLFNRQDQEFEKFKVINAGHRTAHIKAIWANSIFFPFVDLLSSLSIALLYILVVVNLNSNLSQSLAAKYGEIMAFTLWVNQLYRPIRMLADKFNILQRGTVRAERVFVLLDTDSNDQKSGDLQTCQFDANIRFERVYFAYNEPKWVLKDVSFEIEKGSMVAFVGATGAGKTSIVNLLGRFYDYQKGSILIGEHEITELNLNYLRKNIAIVLQDVFLFSDSIFNNITLRDPKITLNQVIEASKAVGAHDFIEKLPDGYHFQVGERGGILSVGQRQLLAFIRAYVYNPQILILDEATSSVDSETEFLIQRATEKLTAGRTSIVIAHRLSTIQKADKIIVLDAGQLVEEGSHQELLSKNGHYKHLFDMQFEEDVLQNNQNHET